MIDCVLHRSQKTLWRAFALYWTNNRGNKYFMFSFALRARLNKKNLDYGAMRYLRLNKKFITLGFNFVAFLSIVN